MKYDGAATDRRQSRPRCGWRRWPASPPTTSCSSPAARRSRRKRSSLEVFRRLQPRMAAAAAGARAAASGAVRAGRRAAGRRRAWPGSARSRLSEDRAAAPGRADPAGRRDRRTGRRGGARPQIAFVGGSLGNRGGQNMIEPAAYGAAVCFGPNTRNFRDIVRRHARPEAAVVVADGGELPASCAAASRSRPRPPPGHGRAGRALVAGSQARAADGGHGPADRATLAGRRLPRPQTRPARPDDSAAPVADRSPSR